MAKENKTICVDSDIAATLRTLKLNASEICNKALEQAITQSKNRTKAAKKREEEFKKFVEIIYAKDFESSEWYTDPELREALIKSYSDRSGRSMTELEQMIAEL